MTDLGRHQMYSSAPSGRVHREILMTSLKDGCGSRGEYLGWPSLLAYLGH